MFYISNRKTAVQKNAGSLDDVKNGGGQKLTYCYVNQGDGLLCKAISIVLCFIFAASDITMEDNWLTLDFRFSLCKLIAGQEKFTVV